MTAQLNFGQEGVTKRIEIKEHSPFLIGRMLQHLYTLNYSGSQESSGGVPEASFISELHTHTKMYAIGDEYDIKDLKEEALRKFEQAVDAKFGESDELTTILQVVPAIYKTTPDSDRGLRDLVVTFGAQHLKRMKDLPELEDVVTQVPKFMVEVLPRYFSRPQHEKRPNSQYCRKCDDDGPWIYDRVVCDGCGTERVLSCMEMVDVDNF